jgi:membrane protein required for beta-lactamase induction
LAERWPFSAGGDGGRKSPVSSLDRNEMISRRAGLISNIRSYLARLFVFAALLVFGAVTLAWWGFLAWLIWHVI